MNRIIRLTSVPPYKRVSHVFDRSITTLSMAAAGLEVLFILQHLLIDTHREKKGVSGDRDKEIKRQEQADQGGDISFDALLAH